MDLAEFDRLASSLSGVRRHTREGLLQWRLHGRLLARQLDEDQVVVRTPFDTRDVLLHQFPDTFTVPPRFRKHMMLVARLSRADPGAIDDAVNSAWRHQQQPD